MNQIDKIALQITKFVISNNIASPYHNDLDHIKVDIVKAAKDVCKMKNYIDDSDYVSYLFNKSKSYHEMLNEITYDSIKNVINESYMLLIKNCGSDYYKGEEITRSFLSKLRVTEFEEYIKKLCVENKYPDDILEKFYLHIFWMKSHGMIYITDEPDYNIGVNEKAIQRDIKMWKLSLSKYIKNKS